MKTLTVPFDSQPIVTGSSARPDSSVSGREILRGGLCAAVSLGNSWSKSPRAFPKPPISGQGISGPLEKALEGVAVADSQDPIEVMRIIHSFDPCLQCAVH